MKEKAPPKKTKTLKRLSREAKALYLLLAIAAGAITFCTIVSEHWDLPPDKWRWLALAAAFLSLPKVYRKLKNNQEPWLVCFAQAYREGFLWFGMIGPELSGWVTKARGLWRNLTRSP